MNTGNLTPKSNTTVAAMRFTGAFAQPNGFGSVLTAKINEAGDTTLTLVYKSIGDEERMWSVVLDGAQRTMLANFPKYEQLARRNRSEACSTKPVRSTKTAREGSPTRKYINRDN